MCRIEEAKDVKETNEAKEKSEKVIEVLVEVGGCLDPSIARPDAPEGGAEEKIGPLRSG